MLGCQDRCSVCACVDLMSEDGHDQVRALRKVAVNSTDADARFLGLLTNETEFRIKWKAVPLSLINTGQWRWPYIISTSGRRRRAFFLRQGFGGQVGAENISKQLFAKPYFGQSCPKRNKGPRLLPEIARQ